MRFKVDFPLVVWCRAHSKSSARSALIGEIRVLRIESKPCHKYRDDSICGGDNESVVFFSGEGGQVRHDGNR